jgi:hypothetical protein
VINEILFNPVKDGYDYMEGYNRSNKAIDLAGIIIANRNSTGDISSKKAVSRTSTLVAPGEYFIVTPSEKWLRQHYLVGPLAKVCQLSGMPSFPDDKGSVVLLNGQDSIIDELDYNEKWHFALIADPEGVALERISYEKPTQDRNNWTSASSSSGFGTPGFQNSQFRADLRAEGEVEVSPKIFSPDNDGVNDFCLIQYKMKERGYIANLEIYDITGRKRRSLLKNELFGLTGQYKWDGLDDASRPLPQGIYILIIEIFNLEGKTEKFKNAIVLARGSFQ